MGPAVLRKPQAREHIQVASIRTRMSGRKIWQRGSTHPQLASYRSQMLSPRVAEVYEKKLHRKREQEVERQKRIFDEKWLRFGLDATALQNQISEKKAEKERQRSRNNELDKVMIEADMAAVDSDRYKAQERRKIAKEIDGFRMSNQGARIKIPLGGSRDHADLVCDFCGSNIPALYQKPLIAKEAEKDAKDAERIQCTMCHARVHPSQNENTEERSMWDVLLLEESNQGSQYRPVASWKGYPETQLKFFYKGQADQANEKKLRISNEKASDLGIDRRIIERSLEELDQEMQGRKKWRSELEKIERFNKDLIDIQKKDHQRMKDEIYDANAISDEFFTKFGISSR